MELPDGTVKPLILLYKYSCIELWRPEEPGTLLLFTRLEFATGAFVMPDDAPKLDLILC